MTTLSTLKKFKKDGTKFTCLTCYDSMFARMMEKAEIDTILIGDSLGMVVQGHDSTLPVTVNDMAYHTANIARSNKHALILADLPFMSYVTLPEAVANSRQLMQAGAHVIKIEGGSELCDLIATLAQAGTPTCVHLGLTPQSVNVFGGYKIQGRGDEAADKLLADAKAVVAAGAAFPGPFMPAAPMRPPALASMTICSTLSATLLRKSPSSIFAVTSASGDLSWVIGNFPAQVEV